MRSASPFLVTSRDARCWEGRVAVGRGRRSAATQGSVDVFEGAYELDRSDDGIHRAHLGAGDGGAGARR